MINAIISADGKQTTVIELPCKDRYELIDQIYKAGIHHQLRPLRLRDDEDSAVRIKLHADNPIGNHLRLLLNSRNTIVDANRLATVVRDAREEIQAELHEKILEDQYHSADELYGDVRQMVWALGSHTQSFYCPLTGTAWDDEHGTEYTVDGYDLCGYQEEIEKILDKRQDIEDGDMAQYFHCPSASAKLVSAVWKTEEIGGKLYGRIDCRLKEALTPEETEALKEWIIGQNSDGLGESVEQQEIPTEDGDLYVSFWHNGDDYFLCTGDELDEHIGQHGGMQLGGM